MQIQNIETNHWWNVYLEDHNDCAWVLFTLNYSLLAVVLWLKEVWMLTKLSIAALLMAMKQLYWLEQKNTEVQNRIRCSLAVHQWTSQRSPAQGIEVLIARMLQITFKEKQQTAEHPNPPCAQNRSWNTDPPQIKQIISHLICRTAVRTASPRSAPNLIPCSLIRAAESGILTAGHQHLLMCSGKHARPHRCQPWLLHISLA